MGGGGKKASPGWCSWAGDHGHTAATRGLLSPEVEAMTSLSEAEIVGLATADPRTPSEKRQAWDRKRYRVSGRQVELLFNEFSPSDLLMVIRSLNKLLHRKQQRLASVTAGKLGPE